MCRVKWMSSCALLLASMLVIGSVVDVRAQGTALPSMRVGA